MLSATERHGVEIWHPYALLHDLKQPVDFVAGAEVLDVLPNEANASSYAIFEGQPPSHWNDSPTLS
ncbi:MAG TPA: hypothetical protein VHM93_24405 [Candidatus Acidoferrum sp.]|nr:hypothetical protein [Candidatus Acidoferrum sp.]